MRGKSECVIFSLVFLLPHGLSSVRAHIPGNMVCCGWSTEIYSGLRWCRKTQLDPNPEGLYLFGILFWRVQGFMKEF